MDKLVLNDIQVKNMINRTFKTTLLFSLIAVLAVFYASCAINEAEEVILGTIKIAAYDSTTSTELVGAEIRIDDVALNVTTPTYIANISAGDHTVSVHPDPTAYSSKQMIVTVTPPDTSDVLINFAPNSVTTEIAISSNQDPVQVILDDGFVEDITTPGSFELTPGDYSISVYKEGFKTVLPALQNITLIEGATENLTFTLEEQAYGNQVGDLFPDFLLPSDVMINDTERDSLTIAQYRGRVVLINFWGYNCEPCRHEFPAIETLYTERANDGFRVLAINANYTRQDIFANFASFREEVNIPTIPLLLNTLGTDFTYETLGFAAIPQNFLVDQSGVIRYRFGATTYDELSGFVSELLD